MIHEKELPFSWFEEHMPLLSPCVRDLPVGVAIKVRHAWYIYPPHLSISESCACWPCAGPTIYDLPCAGSTIYDLPCAGSTIYDLDLLMQSFFVGRRRAEAGESVVWEGGASE